MGQDEVARLITPDSSSATQLPDTISDALTLARIAGHSSIRVTERYVRPRAEAIGPVFRKLVTHGGHPDNIPSDGEVRSQAISPEAARD